jgi:phosphonate transport system substrate-binding protein
MKQATIGICCLSILAIVLPVFAAEKPVIRFGVIPRYNPLVMYKRYQPIMDYLTAETP